MRGVSLMDGKNTFNVDTSFVLFFLAIEFGRIFGSFSFDTFIVGIALLAVMALPYLLQSEESDDFGSWILGRSLIAGFAVILGMLLRQSVGVALPQYFSFIPMTLLIVTAMISCYIQFYGFLRFRLAK